jgi:hypothetical protein
LDLELHSKLNDVMSTFIPQLKMSN